MATRFEEKPQLPKLSMVVSNDPLSQRNAPASTKESPKHNKDSIHVTVREVSNDQALPEKDTSFAAYKVLFAAIILQAGTPAFTWAFGVFQDYYMYQTSFPDRSNSPWIATLSSGIPYLGAPLITYVCEKYAFKRQYYLWFGWSICLLALIGAAFCYTIPLLILTQGLLFGIGNLLIDMPSLLIVGTWFDKRRGLAYGLMFGMCDLSAVGWTYLINGLLHRIGLRNTFLVSAAIAFALPLPAIFFLRERTTISEDSGTRSNQDDFCSIATTVESEPYHKRPIFYILIIANLLQAMAFYLPFVYLPSFATSRGFSTSQGATLLALANVAQIVGEIGFGKLSDMINVNVLVVVVSTVSALSTFTLWGLGNSYACLVVFALLFCCFGSGFMALWARMGTSCGEKDAQMIFSFLSSGRGVGEIASGPISAALLKFAERRSRFGGGPYFGIILFAGTCMATSAVLGVSGLFAVRHDRPARDEKGERANDIPSV